MADWTVPKGRRACTGCQRDFKPAEPVFSVLFLRDKALVREDRCATCEPAVDRTGALSHWRTAAPTPEQPKRAKLDPEAAGELFRRLVADLKPEQRALCYVLGLVLVRRKTLRITGQEEGPPLAPAPAVEGPGSGVQGPGSEGEGQGEGTPLAASLQPPASSLAPATYLLLEERATGTTFRLPDLMLSDAEIDRVTGELKELFQGDV